MYQNLCSTRLFLRLLFIITFFLSSSVSLIAQQSSSKLRIIMIGAHPDDCDQKGGGTAILFAKMGHAVKFVSVTNGDAGHQTEGGGALAKRRMAESLEAGKRFGITYDVLDHHDGELLPTLEVRLEIIRKIREWNADVVITHRPNDYHPDHRYTGILVQDAAYMVGVPNVAPDVPPLAKNPVFLYFQDNFQRPNPFRPDIAVNVSTVFEQKIYAIDAHRSQMYEWLPWIGGYAAEVPSSEKERLAWLSKQRDRKISDAVQKVLQKYYGSDTKHILHAEAFEICEYGFQPNEQEIRQLFPMLKANK